MLYLLKYSIIFEKIVLYSQGKYHSGKDGIIFSKR